jgi:O-antigen/teichoic acid export membrane protein
MSVTIAVQRNILANYLGMGAVILAPILALPWYLSELGTQKLGLIGFITMLQALLAMLDAGMSQALVREVTSRFDRTDQGRYRTASLLFGFERIYWAFSLCAGLVVVLLADSIAKYWLKLDDLPITLGQQALYGAAAIFAAQFPGSIYRSLMIGGQEQVTLNGVMASGALLRHVGGVAVVIAWPTLSAYLIWHAGIALLETLIRGRFAWSLVRVKRTDVKWDSNELRPVWQLVAVMSGATLLGSLTVQIDRLILSQMVGIEQFGHYTIAATIAIGSLQLINPLIQAVLPRAIQLRKDSVKFHKLNMKLAGIIGVIVGFGAITFAVVGKDLLQFWLRSTEVSGQVYPILVVLLMGTALNAFYNVGYLNWLANKKVHRILQVNLLSLAFAAVLIPIFVSSLGTIGAAFGWLTINMIGLVFSLGWLRRRSNERVI